MINQNFSFKEHLDDSILSDVLDTSINGIIVLNKKYQIISWNSWMETHTKIERSHAIGKKILTLFPSLKGRRIELAIINALKCGNSSVLSHALNRDPFPVYLSNNPSRKVKQSIFITPITTAENHRFCAIQIHDVTASVQRENLLHTMAKEAEKSNQIKTEFLSTVSHELRTPLTSILGSLGLICGGSTGDISEKMDVLLQIAKKNSENLLTLINDLLDTDKIESGNMKFNLRPLEVMTFIEESIKNNYGFAITHNVKFKVTHTLENTIINGDETRLSQVMGNLLSNAAKFSPEGETVEISVKRINNNVRVSVIDKGPGIPIKFQPKLFEKFTQSDSSDTRKTGGSGLGLNIVKAIIEFHSGHVYFDTEPGKGTTFHIDLPIIQQPL